MAWKTLSLLSLILCTNSYANLYSCKGAEAKPDLVEASLQIQPVVLEETEPFWVENARIHASHAQNKIPFLIYYAIDSAEPFMQLSVKYEVAQLEKSCQTSGNVNFVALLNSLYLEKNEIIVCRNTDLRRLNLDKYPDLDKRLKLKHKYIGEAEHTSNNKGPMDFLVKYPSNINKPFTNFPLAHPDFLHDLIELVVNEEDIFPTDKYMPFLNLKSHGSSKTILSGLHACQSKAKSLTQEKILGDKLSSEEINTLNSMPTTKDVSNNLGLYNELIHKLNLGTASAVGGDTHLGDSNLGDSNLGDSNLGDSNLGDSNLGDSNLGDAIAGLGANNGLGADLAFGLQPYPFNNVLGRLFNETNGRVLGFVMLESCDTNRNAAFQHTFMQNILGVYSAKHSLWYRNLNWWSLLEKAQSSTVKLIDTLEINTKKIPNIRIIK